MSSTREECARLNAKLEVLEQRQGAAAHQISDAVHTQSVHAEQVDRCMEEHQHRLMVSVNKAECRSREAAEQIAQQAVCDARTSMQVVSVLFCPCLHHAVRGVVIDSSLCMMTHSRIMKSYMYTTTLYGNRVTVSHDADQLSLGLLSVVRTPVVTSPCYCICKTVSKHLTYMEAAVACQIDSMQFYAWSPRPIYDRRSRLSACRET